MVWQPGFLPGGSIPPNNNNNKMRIEFRKEKSSHQKI
jgi:hypothetical protein